MKTSQGLTDNRDQSNESLGQGLFSLDLNLPASCTNQESRTSESLAEQCPAHGPRHRAPQPDYLQRWLPG